MSVSEIPPAAPALSCAERLVKALRREPVDRPPVISLMTCVTSELMEACGIFLPEAHFDACAMAALAAAPFEICGIESVKLPFCMTVEAEALGSAVSFGDRARLPQVTSHPWESYDRLKLPEDYLRRGRIPLVLEAISRCKEKFAGTAPVISCVVGPFTLATKLFPFDDVLADLLLDPEPVTALLRGLTTLCADYVRAQQAAGSDVIQVGEPACSGDVISPELYREFVLPCHQTLTGSVGHDAPLVMHICGHCDGHLPHIARSGFDGFSFEHRTDAELCRKYLGDNMATVGYVDPLGALLNGTEAQIADSCGECVRGGVSVLSAGCAWPPSTSLANMHAFAREGLAAARSHLLLQSD